MSTTSVLVASEGPSLADRLGHCDVTRVETVGAAVDHVTEQPVSCLVTALELRDGTGFELADAVRVFDEHLPVVAVGMEPIGRVAETALAADVDAYLERSDEELAPERLASTVDDAVSQYYRQRDRARVATDAPGITCVIRDGRVVRTGPGLADLLGVQGAEGQALSEMVGEVHRGDLHALLATAEGEQTTVEFTPASVPDGYVECRARRSPRDGALVATLFDLGMQWQAPPAIEDDSLRS